MPEYSDIESAIDYVSSAPRHTNRVVYDKRTARFLYESEMSGESDIPEDIDLVHCIEMPHKHELDLGHNLVFRFIEQTLPDEEDAVHRIFKRSGAYGRFKDFLERRNLLQQWYDFEEAATRKAIERWCRDNDMEIGQQGVSPDSSPAAGSEASALKRRVKGKTMKPKIGLITLGVSDLERSTSFYRDGLGFPTHGNYPGVTFFALEGTWLSLYPRADLERDAQVKSSGSGFQGFTLAHNVSTKAEVDQILNQASEAGGKIVKKAKDADWGGYSGYFADPDGFLWEVAWNPGIDLT